MPASICAAVAAACAVAAIAGHPDGWVVARLGPSVGHGPGRTRALLVRIGRMPFVERVVGVSALGEGLRRAGSTLDVHMVAGAGIAAGAVAGLAAAASPWPAPLLAPPAAFVALRTPHLCVARAARRRRRLIDRDIPLLLDILAAGSFAGLAPQAAMHRAAEVIPGPLADELRTALLDVDLGARWRDRIAALAEDLGARDLRRMVATLTRTESLGASLAEPLALLAQDVRAARRAVVTERARKAPIKMLFPLVFLVLPAFLLLTVVPVLVATLGSIR